jgi:cytochrome c-type biogenesis protein
VLLPSAVAYYLTRAAPEGASGVRRAGRALLLAAMATLGFVVLFAAVGLVIGAGGRALAAVFPVGGLLVGLLLVAGGAWLCLTGQQVGVLAASGALGRLELGDTRSLFLFGVGYAVCSLSCTLPVFLVVAGTALASGGVAAAAVDFVGYALGMGAMLTLVILGAAFFHAAVTRWTRALAPYVHRTAAAFLLGAGIFIVHYWLASGLVVR